MHEGKIMRVIVLTPTRGLLHSRTVEAVQAAVEAFGQHADWLFTHDLPIPDCFNALVERGLSTGADTFWFVEEDVVPQENALTEAARLLIDENATAAFVDYPIITETKNYNCAFRVADNLLWGGTGCLLVKREAFEVIERPWFRNDQQLQVRLLGNDMELTAVDRPYEYGGQDIWFGTMLRKAGHRIAYVDPKVSFCGHAKLDRWGEAQKNDGCHKITVHRKVDQWLA